MNVDALEFFGALIGILWVCLAVCVVIVCLAAAAVLGRAISTRLERRYLPSVARWSRRRAALSEDAGPWACPACHSVSPPTAIACYGCGTARGGDAPELAPAADEPGIFHRPPPVNRFDPSRYRGPGGPAAGAFDATAADARPAEGPGAGPAPNELAAPPEASGAGELEASATGAGAGRSAVSS